MKFEAINKMYTQKVAEWMAKGYWINAGTMGGSQGEYAHVDLTNGSEIIRVLMDDGGEWVDYDKYDSVDVIVGRVPAGERVTIGTTDKLGNTIWNNRLEVISKDSFYKLSHGWRSEWYGTLEEAKAVHELRLKRSHVRFADPRYREKVFEDGAKMVLSFVKRQAGCKSAKLSDIEEVRKVYCTNLNGEITGADYVVEAKGKRFTLKVKEA